MDNDDNLVLYNPFQHYSVISKYVREIMKRLYAMTLCIIISCLYELEF